MSALVATILLEVAGRVGAPIVKSLLEEFVGGKAADIGGTIIDTIAEKAGVAPEKLPDVPATQLEQAIVATESQMPEILVQWNIQQKQAIDLQRAEMDKGGPTWTWSWRPAGMWMFHGLVAWYCVVAPLLNLIMGLVGTSASIEMIVDVVSFLSLYVTFIGLYMGGHTAKDMMSKWIGRKAG